jgi:hypothetical protein
MLMRQAFGQIGTTILQCFNPVHMIANRLLRSVVFTDAPRPYKVQISMSVLLSSSCAGRDPM